MASAPLDDPDDQTFHQFADKTGRNVTDASNVVRALDERIRAIKEDCQETQDQLKRINDGEERNWLIFKLQRQRLLYARYHVRKVGILKKLADYGTLKLPIEELEQLRSDAKNVRHVTTDGAKLMEQYLHQHSEPEKAASEKAAPKLESRPAGRETWHSYFHGLFDRLNSTHEHVESETTDRRKCDTIEAARRFYQEKFVDGMEPMDYDDEHDSSVVSRETILFGSGATGASADAIIERRDLYRDKRQVTEEQIRYVHEHVRSYRLETILQRDQANYLEEELRHLYEKDPNLFKHHFGDSEFKWRRRSSDEGKKTHEEHDVQTIKIIPLDTRPTTVASSHGETGSISVTITSRASEHDHYDGDTTCVSSGQTTPTPTVEVGPLPSESQTKILPLETQGPAQVLLRDDDLEATDLRHQVLTDRRSDIIFDLEETIEKSPKTRRKDLESGAELGHSSRLEEQGQLGMTVDYEEEIHRGPKTRRSLEESYPTKLLLYEGAMEEKPLIITLDRYPREWYYEHLHQEPEETRHLHRHGSSEKIGHAHLHHQESEEIHEHGGHLHKHKDGREHWHAEHEHVHHGHSHHQESEEIHEHGGHLHKHKDGREHWHVEHEHIHHGHSHHQEEIGHAHLHHQKSEEIGQQVQPTIVTYEPTVTLGQTTSEAPVQVLFREEDLTPSKLDEQKRVSETSEILLTHEYEETIEKSPRTRRRDFDTLGQQIESPTTPRSFELKHEEEPSVVFRDEHGRSVERGSTRYEIQVEESVEQSPKTRRRDFDTLGQGLDIHHHDLNYTEFEGKPMIISLDKYPCEWYYDADEEFVRFEEKRRTFEERRTLEVEIEETLERSPAIRRHIEELDLLKSDPSYELPILERQSHFHLLNYNQDVPKIPFHVRRRPQHWHYYEHVHEEPLGQQIEAPPVALPRKEIEIGRLMLRDNEFGQFPLDYYLHRRPDTFEHHYRSSSSCSSSSSSSSCVEVPATVTIEYSKPVPIYTPEPLCILELQPDIEHLKFEPERELVLPTEVGRLLLREEDLSYFLLDDYLRKRPLRFYYETLHHHKHTHHHEHLHGGSDTYIIYDDKPVPVGVEHVVEHLHIDSEFESEPLLIEREVLHDLWHSRDLHKHPLDIQRRPLYYEFYHLHHLHYNEIEECPYVFEPRTEPIYEEPPQEIHTLFYDELTPTHFVIETPIYEVPPEEHIYYDRPPIEETDQHRHSVCSSSSSSSSSCAHVVVHHEAEPIPLQQHFPLIPMWPNEELLNVPFVAERLRSDSKKSEDYLLLKNDDAEKIEYPYKRPVSLSYSDIEKTRMRDYSTTATTEVILLWKEKEFRASLYELEKKKLPALERTTITRRETDPVVRRRSTLRGDYDPPGHITHHFRHSEIHELKRSNSELASQSSLTSDTTASIYEHHLFRYAEMPYSSIVWSYETRDYGVPPHRPLTPILSVPTPSSPLEKPPEDEPFLQREEEIERCELRRYIEIPDEHLHHYYEIIETRSYDYDEDVHFHRESKLYRDREFHAEPFEQPIYDYPYETDEHHHHHLREIPSVDEATPLGQEDYWIKHAPTEPIAEPLVIQPVERPRRVTEDELLLFRTPEMDEIFFDEVWEIFDKRRQPHRLSEIQEETISFGPESSSSKPSSDEKHDVYHKLPQISNEQYGKAPIYDVVHGDSSSSQAISPDLEERYHHSFDYDVHHLHYESDIEYIPLHAVIYEEPIYEEVPEFVPPAVVDLHRHGELESLPLETRPIYYEPQERTYGSFSSFSSDESEVYVENLHPQVELPKSDFYIQKDVLVEQPAKSAIYDRPPFYYEPEPDYAEIVHKPPKLPETPPPRRVQPIERLEREPEFAHEVFNIYDTIYKTISEHEHHHERHVPKEEPKVVEKVVEPEVVEKVVEYKEPTYKFPNVRQMAEDYAHKHKHKHHERIKPPPRLQRLYPDQEFQHTHFEPIKPVTHLHVEPTKPVHVEPVKKKEPLGQRIVRPIEPIRHLRRGTLEFETASDLEYSPIPVRANERFIIPLDVSPFAEGQYVVSESQLATPTESEVGSHHHAGSVKRLSSSFEEPIPFAVQKLKPVPKPEVLPRYQTQKPKTIEQQPQKVVSLQRYRPGTVQSQIFKRKIQETVKINGDEYGVLENQIEKDTYYTAQKHNLVHKHLLDEYTSEDHFLDSYLRTNRWDIPVYLVPNAKQNTPFPLQATRQSRISLGVLLRRKRLSTSAPSGLDRIHLDEARYVYPQQFGQQLSQTSRPVKSPSWKVQSPSRSKSTPFVYTPPRVADFTQDEQGELFKNPAFIKARQHSDAFAWGSIHRQQGREIASVLDEANRLYSAYEPVQKKHHIEQEHKDEARSEHSSHSFGHLQKRHSAHSTTSGHSSHEHFHRHHQDSPIYDTVHEEEPVYKKHKHHSFLPGHQSTEERKYHHEYDVTYEEQGHLMQSRHSHDHGYRYSHPQDDSSGYEPIPFSVRRVQQEEQQPPQLPSTPPPKSPKSFGQILEDKPISVAERLLTKTPSFERRQRHATTRKYSSASEDKPPVLEGSEQRLSPFGARKMYTAEKKKWFDEGSEFSTHDIHDEAEEIHRAVNALRHVHPPVESVTDKEEEQENRAELARANLRHVESGSIRRKRLREPSDDPYIRHPSAPDFRLGLYFANHPFLTHLARSPAYRGLSRYYSRMPELIDGGFTMQNGNTTDELLQAVDNEHTRLWDPTSLLEKMYKIDYNPLVEKRNRFRTMEGHLEVPNEENVTVPQIEKPWKPLYFRIKEGRFQWFAAHGADENPDQDILLVGTKITANKDDWTFRIEGGKENANLLVKAPSNVFEKWRMALLSNAASQLIDAYVQPVKPPVPHYTQKIAFIELGSCSVRAGILTNKPSLPQVFFPAVACLAEDTNEVFVGIDALKPEVRQRGRLHRPIEGSDTSSVERFHLNSRVVEAIVWKAIGDLKIDPGQYKILLSISQDVPTSFVGQLLRLLLNSIQFQSATIARQPSLILYSYDVTTGVVVDIGERLHIVPVIDEYIVDSAIVSLPFGAQQIRDTLKKRLQAQNNQIGAAENTPVEHIVLQEIVKQTCYVSIDPSAESQSSTKQVDLTPYSLGSGFNGRISVDSASHQVVEGLFEPKKWGLEIKGIHHLIHGVIQQSPIDSRRTLYRNIYLAGGTSLLPGLAERLETELSKIAPPSIFVQVLGSPWRFHAAHLGAQVVATSHQFEHCLANKSNVEEYIKQVEADVN